jgi:hypothetical protein
MNEFEVRVQEKLYPVCECGEAFDTIETAYAHGGRCDFKILPESEAL